MNIPLDCIGVIITFLDAVEVFLSLRKSSRLIGKYIDNVMNPKNMEFLKFKLKTIPMNEIGYVHRLIIEGRLPRRTEFEEKYWNDYDFLKLFPRLESLVLKRLNIKPAMIQGKWNLFHNSPSGFLERLKRLKVCDCSKLTSDISSISEARNLESLYLDLNCFILFTSRLDITFIGKLKKLENLTLKVATKLHQYLPLPEDSDETERLVFKPLQNLRYLCLDNIDFLTDVLFQYTPKLRVLKLFECCNFKTGRGFQFLSSSSEQHHHHLQKVVVELCHHVKEEELVSDIGGKPDYFHVFTYEKSLSFMHPLFDTDDSRPKIINDAPVFNFLISQFE